MLAAPHYLHSLWSVPEIMFRSEILYNASWQSDYHAGTTQNVDETMTNH